MSRSGRRPSKGTLHRTSAPSMGPASLCCEPNAFISKLREGSGKVRETHIYRTLDGLHWRQMQTYGITQPSSSSRTSHEQSKAETRMRRKRTRAACPRTARRRTLDALMETQNGLKQYSDKTRRYFDLLDPPAPSPDPPSTRLSQLRKVRRAALLRRDDGLTELLAYTAYLARGLAAGRRRRRGQASRLEAASSAARAPCWLWRGSASSTRLRRLPGPDVRPASALSGMQLELNALAPFPRPAPATRRPCSPRSATTRSGLLQPTKSSWRRSGRRSSSGVSRLSFGGN